MMSHSEISISVGELIGVPRVTLRGQMDGWHDGVVSSVMTSLRDDGASSMILDLTGLEFAGMEGSSALVRSLRYLGTKFCVHVVSSGLSMRILEKAELGSRVKLYTSTDEIAQFLMPGEECFTSRYIPQESDDNQVPKAA